MAEEVVERGNGGAMVEQEVVMDKELMMEEEVTEGMVIEKEDMEEMKRLWWSRRR